uniref:mitogen-activated protein kinase kinase n=1 Tax=Acrobeloides nanus TaxID=290746 RepID=A0A914D0G2_9BILA
MSDFKEIDIIASSRHLVKRMIHEPSNTKLAVKFVHIPHNRHKSNEENSKKLESFIRVVVDFRELRNVSNIVKLYGLGYYDGQALICMELMDLSLKEISLKFIENKEKLNEAFLGYIIVIVLKALVAYKSKGILYQSVKPDNILLNQSGAIKLCGFGESKILQESLASTFNESLCYWPPEYFKNDKSELALANIWSLGISLIELVSGSVPYRGKQDKVPKNIILLQNMITNLDTNKTVDDHFNGYSEEIKKLNIAMKLWTQSW